MAYPDKLSTQAVDGYWLSMNEGSTHAFLAFARGFKWWFEQFNRYAIALRRLDIPATTIWGEHDKVLDAKKLSDQFARDLKIPASDQHVLDAGHFLQEDQRDQVAQLLIKFMEKVQRVSSTSVFHSRDL